MDVVFTANRKKEAIETASALIRVRYRSNSRRK